MEEFAGLALFKFKNKMPNLTYSDSIQNVKWNKKKTDNPQFYAMEEQKANIMEQHFQSEMKK